jgi:hypothetical protein
VIVLGALVLASCSGGEMSGPQIRLPLLTTRAPVLPEPPLVFAHHDALSDFATGMTGSVDRLVVTQGYERSGISYNVSDPPGVKLTVFDFGAWRWRPLPKAHYSPVALPDGLASVGLTCGPKGEDNARCQVEVSTLRWGDADWRDQQVTRHAEWVHEGGSVRLLGVRGKFAYFEADREEAGTVVRLTAAGDVKLLPSVPRPNDVIGQPVTSLPSVTCTTPTGLETVQVLGGLSVGAVVSFGPVLRLDERSQSPRWQTVSGTTPLTAPGVGADRAFVCGPDGLVLLHATGTSALIGNRFVTLSSALSPRFPSGGQAGFASIPMPDGGLVYSDYQDLHRLIHGDWLSPIPMAGKHPWTTVGELVAYQVVSPTTGLLEFHVTR